MQRNIGNITVNPEIRGFTNIPKIANYKTEVGNANGNGLSNEIRKDTNIDTGNTRFTFFNTDYLKENGMEPGTEFDMKEGRQLAIEIEKASCQYFTDKIPKVTKPIMTHIAQEVTPIDSDLMKDIRQAVIDFMGHFKKKFESTFSNLKGWYMASTITSMTASLFSIVTSAYTLYRCETNYSMKTLHGISMVCALTNLTTTVAGLCTHWKIAYDLSHANTAIDFIITDMATKFKTNSANSYLKMAIMALTTLLCCGCVKAGYSDMKGVIQMGSFSRAVREMSTDATAIAETIAEDVLQLDLKGDNIVYEEIRTLAKRSVELVTTPLYAMVTHGEMMKELQEFPKHALEACSRKMISKTTQKSIQNCQNVITSNIQLIQEKSLAVKAITDQKPRIETLGVYISGAEGIGKSRLVNFLKTNLANQFGYEDVLYDLAKQTNGFHLPYGGGAFGVVNEFMARRAAHDEFLPYFNTIVSSNPANLEAAHLSGKVQPVHFKCVFLTGNSENPVMNVDGGITKAAAKALWSRVLRYEITDPKCQGRMGLNEHRQSDFSHLHVNSIKIRENGGLLDEDLVKTGSSIQQMYNDIVLQMAQRELEFMKSYEKDASDNTNFELRKQTLTRIVGNTVRANSGKNFFVIRLQGVGGAGKSTYIELVTNMFKTHFPQLPVIKMDEQSLKMRYTYEDRAIYVFDDKLYEDEVIRNYVQWINLVHPLSIIIIGINQILEPTVKRSFPMFWKTHEVYEMQSFDSVPTGYYRRIGLDGFISVDGQMMNNDLNSGFNITCETGYRMRYKKEYYSVNQMLDILFKGYISFVERSGQITWINAELPQVHPQIHIRSDTSTELFDVLADTSKILQAFVGIYGTTKFEIDKQFADKLEGNTVANDWLVTEQVEGLQGVKQVAERMYYAVRRVDPNAIIKLIVADTVAVLCEKNKMYIQVVGDIGEDVVTCDQQNIYVAQEMINHDDIVDYMLETKVNASIEKYPESYLRKIRSIIECSKQNHLVELKARIALAKDERYVTVSAKSLLRKFFDENRQLFMIAGTVIAVYVGYLCTKKIYSWMTEERPKNYTNSSDDEERPESKYTTEIRQRILKGQKYADVYKSIQDQPELYNKVMNWELEYRSNSSSYSFDKDVNASVAKKDYPKLVQLAEQQPTLMANYLTNMNTTHANMVCEEDVFQNTTKFDLFLNKIKKNLVVVQNRTDGGICYGIVRKMNRVRTVAHVCGHVGNEMVIRESGKKYHGKVVAIERERDMAEIEITDRTWQSKPDLTNMIIDRADINRVLETWFVRLDHDKIMSSRVTSEYIEHSRVPVVAFNDPTFSLESEYWLAAFALASEMRHIIRDGDCGMPLIGCVDNQFYIIGIHNSYSALGTATFSLVYKNDVDVLENRLVYKANDMKKQYEYLTNPVTRVTCAIDPHLYEAISSDYETSKFANLSPALDVWGYNKKLHFYTKPAYKKKCNNIGGLPILKRPAALRFDSRIHDPTDLVKDKFGNPHTLMTQAFRYTKRMPTYGKWSQTVFDHTLNLIKLRYDRDYGINKALNMKQVLNGTMHLKPIELDTSPGPMFKYKFAAQDKTKIFKNLAAEGKPPYYEVNMSTPEGREFKEIFEHYDDAVKHGVPIFVLSKDNAKVELIATEKARKGNVRLFNEVCVCFNSILKKYFGDLIDKVQQQWMKGPYAMGANHYLLGSCIRTKFATIEGQVQNTDYSKMDKSYPKELIDAFCEVALRNFPLAIRQAICHSLTYVLHTLDGHVYSVKNGNESGTFVTTLLNCFGVEFPDMYTFVEWYYDKYHVYPGLHDAEAAYVEFICGDDATLKVRHNTFTVEDRARVSALFNLDLTAAKVTSQNPSFCSRDIEGDELYITVAYPKLKQSSITAALMYFEEDPLIIAMNCNVALFEASLHDKEFFTVVQGAVEKIATHYCIKRKIERYPYEFYRDNFRQYVMGIVQSPGLMALEYQTSKNKVEQFNFANFKNNRRITDFYSNDYEQLMNYIIERMDAVSQITSYVQKNKLPPVEWIETAEGEPHKPLWTIVLRMKAIDGFYHETSGVGTTKSIAKQDACQKMVVKLYSVNYVNSLSSGSTMEQREDQGLEMEFNQHLNSRIYITYNQHSNRYELRSRIHEGVIIKAKKATALFAKVELLGISFLLSNTVGKMMKKLSRIMDENSINVLYLHFDKHMTGFKDDRQAYKNARLLNETFGVSIREWEYEDGLTTQKKLYVLERMPSENLSLTDFSLRELRIILEDYNDGTYAVYSNAYGVVLALASFYENDSICRPPLIRQSPSMIAKANMDNGKVTEQVETSAVAVRQAAVNQQLGNIPLMSNPQPTGQAPVLTQAGEFIQAAQEIALTTELNPIGPPISTLAFGAVTFDIKTLVYSQFMDTDQQIVWDESMPAGTILAQIPYDPLSTFTNAYIHQYVEMHERYTGSIQFRFTVIGTPLYTGVLGIAWYPRKVTTTTTTISEMQKYAYEAHNVTQPFNIVHTLHDARREQFYRSTSETDLAGRPHLVVFSVTTLENPLKDAVVVRIRIASKLSNINDKNPFVVANPIITGGGSTMAKQGDFTVAGVNGSPIASFFNGKAICTDGPRSHVMTKTSDDDQVINFKFYSGETFNAMSSYGTYNVVSLLTDNQEPDGTAGEGPYKNDAVDPDWEAIPYISVQANTTKRGWEWFRSQVSPDREDSVYSRLDKLLGVRSTVSSICGLNDVPVLVNEAEPHSRWIWATNKLITEHGTFVVNTWVLYRKPGYMPFGIDILGGALDIEAIPYAPIIPIDGGSTYFNATTPFLPPQCLSLNITSIPISTITFDGYTSPTCTTDYDILQMMWSYRTSCDPTSVLQLEARDTRTGGRIFTARYDDVTNELYIKAVDVTKTYAQLPTTFSYISLSINTVLRASEFPLTNNTTWTNRVNPALQVAVINQIRGHKVMTQKPRMIAKANAGAALGGIMAAGSNIWGSVIGGATSIHNTKKITDVQWDINQANIAWQRQAQANDLAMRENLFNKGIDWQRESQSNMFGFQFDYQENEFGQQKSLQKNAFNQDIMKAGFTSANRFI